MTTLISVTVWGKSGVLRRLVVGQDPQGILNPGNDKGIEMGCPPSAESPSPAAGGRPDHLGSAQQESWQVSERLRGAVTRLRGRSELAPLALVGLLLCELLLVLVATAHRWEIVANAIFAFHSGLAWPFAGLASALPDNHAFMVKGFTTLVLAMSAFYLVVLFAKAPSTRWVVVALGCAYLLVVLSPVLISKDVYLYLAYAKLGAAHHRNPYVTPPVDLGGRILHYITWKHQRTPYGPVFTLATYPLGLLSLANALWLIKLATVAAALGCIALVWKCAQLLDISPAPAALAVGLNPLFLIYGVAGSHNDIFMMALVLAGVWLALSARERMSAIATVAAVGVKLAAAPIAPFVLLISIDRRRVFATAAAVGIALLGFSLLIFGLHIFGVTQQADTVGRYSIPRLLASPLGVKPGAACDRHAAKCNARALSLASSVILAIAILVLLAWVLRGGDALTASGWAACALIVTLTSIQPWYFVWVLPLAVLSRSRRLHLAAALLGLILFFTAWPLGHDIFHPFAKEIHRLL